MVDNRHGDTEGVHMVKRLVFDSQAEQSHNSLYETLDSNVPKPSATVVEEYKIATRAVASR